MIGYKEIAQEELNRELFSDFRRRQVVTDCWRKIDGEWVVRSDPFVDEWSEEEYQELLSCLKNTVRTGGIVYGAYENEILKGFVSVEAKPLGSKGQYLDLSSIHVSEDKRGSGIGGHLFSLACDWAREHGAKKLYISAHSAVETQAFYRSRGCVEAEEYNKEHCEREPYDCQMEYLL